MLTPQDRARLLQHLCMLASHEQDAKKLIELTKKINEILEEERSDPKRPHLQANLQKPA
jgi:hypothetical protein